MPLVLYRIVDVFDGLERNEDGDYEDGYSRIQTRELIEGWVTGATDGAPNLMVASTDGAPTDGARAGSQHPSVNGRPVTLTRSSQDSAVLEFGAASEASGPQQIIQVLEGLGCTRACNAITDSQSKELEHAWEICGGADDKRCL